MFRPINSRGNADHSSVRSGGVDAVQRRVFIPGGEHFRFNKPDTSTHQAALVVAMAGSQMTCFRQRTQGLGADHGILIAVTANARCEDPEGAQYA